MELSKGQSPFYPGQPVPVERFVGRQNPDTAHLVVRGGASHRRQTRWHLRAGQIRHRQSSMARYTQAECQKQRGINQTTQAFNCVQPAIAVRQQHKTMV